MNKEAAYPTAVMMLVCFQCEKSFNTGQVYVLQCRHLICYACGEMNQYYVDGKCVKCKNRIPINEQLTAYFKGYFGAEYTLDTQYIRQCVDYMFVPCPKTSCQRVNCPFDHSEYAKEISAAAKEVKKIQVKVCRRCKVRGPNAATQCVRCKGQLVAEQMNEVTAFGFQEQPVFSYYSSKRI